MPESPAVSPGSLRPPARAVQPHGVLLAASLPGLAVTHCSANVANVLTLPPDAVLGRPLAGLLPAADAAAAAAFARTTIDGVIHDLGHYSGAAGWHLLAHRVGGQLLVEFYPDAPACLGTVAPVSDPDFELVTPDTPAADAEIELCRRICRHARTFTGYDRVQVRRYDANGSGRLIAEDRRLESAFRPGTGDLRVPLTPRDRDAFLRQRVRALADADAAPVPVVGPVVGPDLTHCALAVALPERRVALRAIGVRAALAAAVVRDGELWGVIVGHHPTPRVPDWRSCVLLDALARHLGGQLAASATRTAGGLRDLLRRVSQAVAASRDAVSITDPDGNKVYVNPAFARLTGYALDELTDTAAPPFVGEPAVFAEIAAALARSDTGWAGPVTLRTRDGELVPAELRVDPLRGDDGALLGYVRQYIDLRERQRAAAELRESRHFAEKIVQAIPDLLFIYDRTERRMVYLHQQAGNPCFDLDTLRQLGAEQLQEIIHPDDLRAVRAAFDALHDRRTDLAPEVEFRGRAADGRYLWHRLSAAVFSRADDGNAVQILGLVRDITAAKQLEEQLRQSQKMEAVGRLAGGIAHDFNNLLTVINGYSDMLLKQMPAASAWRELVDEVRKAGESARLLTRQLLSFSRKQVVQPKPLDLNRMLSELEKMLGRVLGEHIRLKFRLEPGAGQVLADRGQLEQVVMNLAVNAHDAMPGGGTLRVETRRVAFGADAVLPELDLEAGDYLLLAVADTGGGMDEATRARIFEPFFTTKGPAEGTGLGLATVFGIVTELGGRIACDTSPGAGTTFRIYLPRLVEAPEVVAAAAPPEPLPLARPNRESVLLVEDNDLIRRLTKQVLSAQGYRVTEAHNGPMALRLLDAASVPFDLLVTDLVMPKMNGRDLADRILARCPSTRVLYLSGYTEDALFRQKLTYQDMPFLQKPFAPEELLRKIRDVLAVPAAQAG